MTREIVPHNQLPLLSATPFEQIKHTDDPNIPDGYWFARELMPTLGYDRWQNFQAAISRAKTALESSGYRVSDHVTDVSNMIGTGKGAKRKVDDLKLSRFACHFIAVNGDPAKSEIALAQAYFIIVTRQHELEKANPALKHKQDVVAYQLQGHSAEWANERVDNKQSQKQLNTALTATHIDHKPDYGAIAHIQIAGLFDMTKREIINYLGLLPKDEDKYRDRLGYYAQQAIKTVNYTAVQRMKTLGRDLTTDEQSAIVKKIVAIVAPSMRDLAEIAGQDYISGADLNNPLPTRNVPLLPSGDK